MITFPSLSLSLQTMSRDTGQHRKCETVRVKEEPLKSQKNGGKTRSRCCVATRCPAAHVERGRCHLSHKIAALLAIFARIWCPRSGYSSGSGRGWESAARRPVPPCPLTSDCPALPCPALRSISLVFRITTLEMIDNINNYRNILRPWRHLPQR